MKKSERASIVRVLIDLIKADSVIDEGEMALYAKLKYDYNISREDEISASSMTLSDASMYGDEEQTTKLALMGSLTLYLDFINLFLYLLRFMGNRK